MKNLLQVVLLLAAGGVAGWFANVAFAPRQPGAAPQPVGPAEAARAPSGLGTPAAASADWRPGLESVQARLAALETAIVGLTEAVAAQRAVDARTPATAAGSANLAEMQASIDALRVALEGHLETDQLVRDSFESLAALKERHAETDWTALREIMDLWRVDEEAATDKVRLSTPAEIVRRFGAPHEVWTNDRGTNWVYQDGVDAVTGESVHEVWICFQEGYLTMLGVKQP